ncbi:MAG: PAS domain S-box protein, partial [Microvirga sp.]
FGLHLKDAVGATAYQRVRPFVESALAGRQTSHEWWAAFPEGLRYTRSEYVPDRREDGSVAGFYVLASDLTPSRTAELALAQSESRLRLALDAGRMAVWESDVATDTVKSSPAFNRLMGFPPEARPTMDEIRSRYVAGGRDHLTNVMTRALARGDRYAETELGVVWPDGSRHWLLLRAQLNVDENGRATGAVGVVLDISERKEAAERIRFQAHLLDAVDEAVIATDLQGTVIFWNRFAERLYGWPAAEAMGRPVVDLTSRSDPARIERTMRHLVQGGSWSGPFTATHRDGSTFPAHVTDAPIFDEAGRQVGIVGVSFDITDRIRREEHQKVLINELNHRVKNSLATAQSIASQSLRTSPTPQAAREAIERRLVALSRAHDVLTRENWEGASLREIVRQAIEPHQGGSIDRFDVHGHDVRLPPRIALALAMALQELTTNALKYGALSNDTGCVRISWVLKGRMDAPHLVLHWEEVGGPIVGVPERRGFGVRLIERSLAQELDGAAKIRFEPAGVLCSIEAPLKVADYPLRAET